MLFSGAAPGVCRTRMAAISHRAEQYDLKPPVTSRQVLKQPHDHGTAGLRSPHRPPEVTVCRLAVAGTMPTLEAVAAHPVTGKRGPGPRLAA